MAEQINLTTPETPPSNTHYRVQSLHLNWFTATIHVQLIGANNEIFTAQYEGQEALALMSALNTANLTNNSLHKRILTKLIADGKLAGTITGSPA